MNHWFDPEVFASEFPEVAHKTVDLDLVLQIAKESKDFDGNIFDTSYKFSWIMYEFLRFKYGLRQKHEANDVQVLDLFYDTKKARSTKSYADGKSMATHWKGVLDYNFPLPYSMKFNDQILSPYVQKRIVGADFDYTVNTDGFSRLMKGQYEPEIFQIPKTDIYLSKNELVLYNDESKESAKLSDMYTIRSRKKKKPIQLVSKNS